MASSEARIAASKRNGALSKGPVSDQGKSISRRNSLKHGMTGAGVVLPEEDAAEVERRTVAYGQEMGVSSEIGVALARRAALGAVRMERGAQLQSAALTERVRQVRDEFEAPEGADDAEAARVLALEINKVMLEPSGEAILARKYESAAERSFFRCLKELQRLRRQAKADEGAAVEQMVGSFLAMREEDREMEAFFAEADKNWPPMSPNSPIPAPMESRADVPASPARRR